MTLDVSSPPTHYAPPLTLIRDLPVTERPRERLAMSGADALSSQELLAILLRTGSARESAIGQASGLLARFGGLAGLARATFAELCTIHGIGEAKAAQIQAALTLGIRMASVAPEQRVQVGRPDDIADIVMAEMSMFDQEHVRVALLDSRTRIIAIPEVYVGSVHTAAVRLSELLRDAIRANAVGMVLIHNHPSGDASPSSSDIFMTKQLFEASRLMDIALHDHLVIGGGTYTSMRHLRAGFPADGSSPSLPQIAPRHALAAAEE